LRLEFIGEAKKLWDSLRAEAFRAAGSDDKKVARAGRLLLAAMNEIQASDKLLTISMDRDGPTGTGIREDGPGRYGIRINPGDRTHKNARLDVVLAHELGHAHSWMIEGWNPIESYFRSIGFENYGRTVAGCGNTSWVYAWLYQRACQ
jgi:hypothetical protein